MPIAAPTGALLPLSLPLPAAPALKHIAGSQFKLALQGVLFDLVRSKKFNHLLYLQNESYYYFSVTLHFHNACSLTGLLNSIMEIMERGKASAQCIQHITLIALFRVSAF